MEKTTTVQPSLGTWDKLPTEEVERKPKITFDVNIPVEILCLENDPKEFQGDNGAYYVFKVKELPSNEEKVIMTSAWSLLRGLKTNSPLKGKKLSVVKKIVKGKQFFEVVVSK